LAIEIGWEPLVLKVRKRNKEREKGKEMEWKLEERDKMGKERDGGGGVVKEGIEGLFLWLTCFYR
jgi:hypothetical protein